jgi:hypothetical protein
MTRGSIIGGSDDITRASLASHAIQTRRDPSFQLAGLAGPVSRSHGTRRKKDHASFPDRPFLVQFLIDVAAVLCAFLLVAVTGAGIAFAAFCLFFVSF